MKEPVGLPASSTPIAGASIGPPRILVQICRFQPSLQTLAGYRGATEKIPIPRGPRGEHRWTRKTASACNIRMPLMKQALRGTAIPGSSSQKSAPDRISALPDELLLHVMYFLTLQEAAQTSLLSRRWQNLWASLMWLNFDAAKFSSMRTYRKFVNNALLIRSSLPVPVPLDAFWISAECDNSDDSLDYSDMPPMDSPCP